MLIPEVILEPRHRDATPICKVKKPTPSADRRRGAPALRCSRKGRGFGRDCEMECRTLTTDAAACREREEGQGVGTALAPYLSASVSGGCSSLALCSSPSTLGLARDVISCRRRTFLELGSVQHRQRRPASSPELLPRPCGSAALVVGSRGYLVISDLGSAVISDRTFHTAGALHQHPSSRHSTLSNPPHLSRSSPLAARFHR